MSEETETPRRDTVEISDRDDHSSGSALLGSAAWLSVAMLLPQVYTLVLSIGAARFLQPADMGRQSYISFVSSTATMLAALGLPMAIQRFTATAAGEGRPGGINAFAMLAWRASPLSAGIAFVSVMAVSLTAYPDLRVAWLLAACSSAFTAVHSLASNVLFGLRRYVQATVIGVTVGGAGVVATFVALALGYGITGLIAVQAAGALVITVGTVVLALRALRPYRATRESLRGRAREITVFTAGIGFTLVIEVVVSRRSEFFFLQAFSRPEQIAFYSVAFAAAAAVQKLPSALVQLVISTVSSLAGAQQHERIARGYGRSLRLMVAMSLPMTAAVMALGPLAIRIAYGEPYAEAGLVLVVLAPVMLVLSTLSQVATAALNALGRLRSPVMWGGVSLVATIALDFALIPRFDALGAAAANNGGVLAGGLVLIVIADRVIGARWLRASLLRPLGTAALAGGVAYMTGGWVGAAGPVVSLLVGGLAFLLVFATSSSVVGIFDRDDAQWLAAAMRRRAAPLARIVDLMTRRSPGF